MSEAEWRTRGAAMGRAARRLPWRIAAWLDEGERVWGKTYRQAAAVVGLSVGRLHNLLSVYRAFDSSRRHEILSPEHHEVVRRLPAEEQDRLLALAEQSHLGVREVKRRAREIELQVARAAVMAEAPAAADEMVRHCDMRDFLPTLRAVDVILTDPPYDAASLPLYVDLARLAATALAPAGLLAVMFGGLGAAELNTVTAMHAHLPFRAVLYMVFTASNRLTRHWPSGLLSQTKPLTVFGRGTKKLPAVTNTVLVSETEKTLHPWQQPLGAMRAFVERLSVPGDLVVDPFCGTGTTGVAAVTLGRRFVGCDVDGEIVQVARARIGAAKQTAKEAAA